MSEKITQHGVFMCVYQMGLLLIGESGIGKSELALTLIKNGHQLIADDIVELREKNQYIEGKCPALLQDFIEVRGLGILNARKLFGDKGLKMQHSLDLIIELKEFDKIESINRLEGIYSEKTIFSATIPIITLPVKVGRDLAVLVETAVLNQQLRNTGYYAEQDFITQQRAQLQ